MNFFIGDRGTTKVYSLVDESQLEPLGKVMHPKGLTMFWRRKLWI